MFALFYLGRCYPCSSFILSSTSIYEQKTVLTGLFSVRLIDQLFWDASFQNYRFSMYWHWIEHWYCIVHITMLYLHLLHVSIMIKFQWWHITLTHVNNIMAWNWLCLNGYLKTFCISFHCHRAANEFLMCVPHMYFYVSKNDVEF